MTKSRKISKDIKIYVFEKTLAKPQKWLCNISWTRVLSFSGSQTQSQTTVERATSDSDDHTLTTDILID